MELDVRPAGLETFEAFASPHLEYLYALARRLCGQPEAAEDVVQEALLRAYRGLPQLRNREHPRLWLTKVLTSVAMDRFRREADHVRSVSLDDERQFSLFDALVEEDPFPYSDRLHLDFLDLFDDQRLVAVLQCIQPEQRTALILAYVYGFKAREIAEMTKAPLGTVLARLSRGRKHLERSLWEYAKEKGLIEG